MKRGLLENKTGQVWIETVIYTAIALLMIGLVLTYAKPKIEEFQDKAVLEKSLEIIRTIDEVIRDMRVAGNRRFVEVGIQEGSLKIDGEGDMIVFEMESRYVYSQPGETINDSLDGRIIINTEEGGELDKVTFAINYSDYSVNITYQEKDEFKTLSKAPMPYKLLISNNGKSGDDTIIDISLNEND